LSICTFWYDICIVYPSANYGFWLRVWYLQSFATRQLSNVKDICWIAIGPILNFANKATTWFCNYVVEHVQVNMLIDCYLRSFEQYFSYIHDDNKCIYHEGKYEYQIELCTVVLYISNKRGYPGLNVGNVYRVTSQQWTSCIMGADANGILLAERVAFFMHKLHILLGSTYC
jgi:hypothetical protein